MIDDFQSQKVIALHESNLYKLNFFLTLHTKADVVQRADLLVSGGKQRLHGVLKAGASLADAKGFSQMLHLNHVYDHSFLLRYKAQNSMKLNCH